jgi:hypothetical protein
VSTTATRCARTILLIVFATAAALKAENHLSDGHSWQSDPTLLDNPLLLWTAILCETLIALAFLSPWWRTGCAAAIVLVVVGNVVYALSVKHGAPAACGCYGRVVLTQTQHVVLSAVVFVLSAGPLLGQRKPKTPHERRRTRGRRDVVCEKGPSHVA